MVSIPVRLMCLVIGYAFGLFQTGYIFGKMNGIDIRTRGSGNSGTTNTLRVLGKKAGAIVLLGDVLKLALACYLTMHLFNGGHFWNEVGPLLALYTGFGTVLGHNYPFFLQFRGGKGIACSAGMFIVLDIRIALIELAVFVTVVLITHYVSVGSICLSVVFFITWVVFNRMGWLTLAPELFPESAVLVFLWAALAIWRHRSNIQRLMKGCENKLF